MVETRRSTSSKRPRQSTSMPSTPSASPSKRSKVGLFVKIPVSYLVISMILSCFLCNWACFVLIFWGLKTDSQDTRPVEPASVPSSSHDAHKEADSDMIPAELVDSGIIPVEQMVSEIPAEAEVGPSNNSPEHSSSQSLPGLVSKLCNYFSFIVWNFCYFSSSFRPIFSSWRGGTSAILIRHSCLKKEVLQIYYKVSLGKAFIWVPTGWNFFVVWILLPSFFLTIFTKLPDYLILFCYLWLKKTQTSKKIILINNFIELSKFILTWFSCNLRFPEYRTHSLYFIWQYYSHVIFLVMSRYHAFLL